MATDVAGASGVSGRYAAALYDLAEEGVLDAVAGDLASLQRMIDESDDFRRFIKSPILSRADQAKGIKAITETAQLAPVTAKFLGLVARNRRLFALPGMIKGFRDILAEHRGQATAQVVSAAPLSDSQRMSLEGQLKKTVGRNVDIALKVDPSILGGLIVRVGSRMVDSSLRSKLSRLKLAMKGVG